MPTHSLYRSLLAKPTKTLASVSLLFSRTFYSSSSLPKTPASLSPFSLPNRVRPLAAVLSSRFRVVGSSAASRALSTRATSSSLNDPNPNWSNRPPKETILLDGCDFEHWLVVMEKPEGEPTRDEIIDSYIKTLAMVVGSEEEARKKIYSVSTRCYYAFGALVSEELSYKIKELARVRWVLPDSYLDVKNKDYGGEPFIDGKAVPYDPKYHEEWIRNNSRAMERNRRNDRPRNFDRSRNFERRRENMRAHQEMSPMASMQNSGPMTPPNNMSGVPLNNNISNMPPNNNMGRMPPNNIGGIPPNMAPNNMDGTNPNMTPPFNSGGMPPNNMGGPNMGGAPPNSMRGMPQGVPPNVGWSGNLNPNPNYQPSYQNHGAMQNPQNQNNYNYNPNRDGGNSY